jgi:hypothetical protein
MALSYLFGGCRFLAGLSLCDSESILGNIPINGSFACWLAAGWGGSFCSGSISESEVLTILSLLGIGEVHGLRRL